MKQFFKNLYSKIYFDKKTAVFSAIYGFLMGLALVLGYQLQKNGYTMPGLAGKFKIFLLSLLIMIPIALISYFIFLALKDLTYSKNYEVKAGKWFWLSFAAIVITRIPVFLAYYPAVMSYDFGRQYWEALCGHEYFFDYQPIIHTELIRIFYLIGQKLGSDEVGMALLTVFQILVTSFILAYSVSVAVRITKKKWVGITLAVIYALLPLHTLISVIMTKDVLFSVFFLLFVCLLYERTQKETVWLDIAIVLTAVLNITFRKNSVYAMLFLVIGYLIYEKGWKKKLLSAALILVCIIAGKSAHNAMVTGFNAIRGSNTEMYSVPMMQLMRAYVNQKDNLTDEQYDMIYEVLPLEVDGINYAPYVADCVKNYSVYREGVWSGSPSNFAKQWLAIGKAYPNDYIDAFLCLNEGYWYLPDKVYAEVFGVGAEDGKGLLHTYNCTEGLWDAKVDEHCYLPPVRRFFEIVINDNGFFKWPVLNILFRPAFYFWLLILASFVAILRKNKSGFVFITYPLLYMATLFFGPLVYIRYMYPLILTVPILIILMLNREKSE